MARKPYAAYFTKMEKACGAEMKIEHTNRRYTCMNKDCKNCKIKNCKNCKIKNCKNCKIKNCKNCMNICESNDKNSIDYTAKFVSCMFGQDLKIDWFHETDDMIYIRLVSTSDSAICPICGKPTTDHHCREVRYLMDLFMFEKPCILKVVLFRYACYNDHKEFDTLKNRKCKRYTFVEETSLASKYATRTIRTDAFLLELAIISSFRGTADAMTSLGAPIDHTSVGRVLKSIFIEIETAIRRIGVDDVSKHKGMSYYTVVYDAVTHMCLALMEGRDGVELKAWLEAHPEVEEVMRDRASAYAKVVSEVLGDDCIQVADKFHLIDNLNKHLQDALYGQMPEKTKIYVQYEKGEDGKCKSATILDKAPPKLYTIPKPVDNRLINLKYDCTPPVNLDGTLVKYDFRVGVRSEKAEKLAAEKREDKMKTALAVREHCAKLQANGEEINYDTIKKKFELSKYMAQKYLAMSEEEVMNIAEPPKSKVTEPVSRYIHTIYKMKKDGIDSWDIYRYIYFHTDFCKDLEGYELESAQNRLASYINSVISNNFPDQPAFNLNQYAKCHSPANICTYTRTDISRYLLTTNPDTPRDERLELVMPQLVARYPIIDVIHNCAASFREVMNGDDADELDKWIEKNKGTVASFCKGLSQDIEPVKNAIRTHDTSGFVEGSNTAFKLVKRIGCGRYSPKCLRIKFTLFLARKRGINPYEIIRTRKLVI